MAHQNKVTLYLTQTEVAVLLDQMIGSHLTSEINKDVSRNKSLRDKALREISRKAYEQLMWVRGKRGTAKT